MTRNELIRLRRQMHRRIREVVAERRMTGVQPHPGKPPHETSAESDSALLR